MTTEIDSDSATKDKCICKGNWRMIIAETEKFFDKQFVEEHSGDIFTFIGVLHGSDDYYYAMTRKGSVSLLSCVGSIEGHGFKLLVKQN